MYNLPGMSGEAFMMFSPVVYNVSESVLYKFGTCQTIFDNSF
jgi:predicted heme/steroid binding protein